MPICHSLLVKFKQFIVDILIHYKQCIITKSRGKEDDCPGTTFSGKFDVETFFFYIRNKHFVDDVETFLDWPSEVESFFDRLSKDKKLEERLHMAGHEKALSII